MHYLLIIEFHERVVVILNEWNSFHTWARQWFGSRLCLHADLQGGTKATDTPGPSEPETPGSAGGTPAAHSWLCKYFFWARVFLKQNSEPPCGDPDSRNCLLFVKCKTSLHWLVWLEPPRCFLRPSVERVSGHSRGGVFSVVSPRRVIRVGASPEAEGELIRNWGCFDLWVAGMTFWGLLVPFAKGSNVCSSLCFAFSH